MSTELRPRFVIALSILFCLAGVYGFSAVAASVGGVDGYYYLLYARDLLADRDGTSFARYFYFPGVYYFWMPFSRLFADSFECFQKVLVGLLIANAAMTALVVYTLIRRDAFSIAWCSLVFVSYLAIASRPELKVLTIEAIITAVFLAGSLLALKFARQLRFHAVAVCLGIAAGLSTFTKQQGALIPIAVTMYLIGPIHAPSIRQTFTFAKRLKYALIFGGTALTAFALAFAFDGGGVSAMRFGLQMADEYQTHRSMLTNLLAVHGEVFPALELFLLSIALWVWFNSTARKYPNNHVSELEVVGVSTAIGALSLIQFAKRSYGHYVLLGLPFALIAVALSAYCLVRLFARQANTNANSGRIGVTTVLVLLLTVIPLLSLLKLRTGPAVKISSQPLHSRYTGVCKYVTANERLLLLPSRQNAIHWACNTHARRTRWGYTFNHQERPDEYIEELRKPDLKQFFAFAESDAYPYEQSVYRAHDWDPFFRTATELGFKPVAKFEFGMLYVKVAGF